MNETEIRVQIVAIESELKHEESNGDLLNDAGVGYYLLGEFETSRKYLEKAVEINRQASYLFNLAITYSELEMAGKAIDTYLQVLDIDPVHIGALNNLADEYERNGDPEKAHELFHYLTKIQPGKAISHFNFGNFFLRQNQHIEASKCYEAALKNNPGFADAYYNIAWILLQAKAYKEGIAFAEKGLQVDPNHNDLAELLETLRGLL